MESLSCTLNISGKVRRVVENGIDYDVVPVTSVVPGVLNGSKGALYYPPEQIKASASRWNGMPIVVYHPQQDGDNVSASMPGIWESQGIGNLRATEINRGRLQHEAWIEVNRANRVDPRVMQAIKQGLKMEVSTGLFTDNLPAKPGSNINGKPYDLIATNYQPDHLAILPDQVGACSVNDGCGLLVNVEGKKKCPT